MKFFRESVEILLCKLNYRIMELFGNEPVF
jgi:hypothetical protein